MTPEPRICVVLPASALASAVHARANFPVIAVGHVAMDAVSGKKADDQDLIVVIPPGRQDKGGILQFGCEEAGRRGFTHVITVDTDDSYSVDVLPAFERIATETPDAILVGVRDLKGAGSPVLLRMLARISVFWFRLTTGIGLSDTQFGCRCYPLDVLRRLRVSSGGRAFEIEALIRASWAGVSLVEVPVAAVYHESGSRLAGFGLFAGVLQSSHMHAKLAFLAFCVPRVLLAMSARGDLEGMPFLVRLRIIVRHVFQDNVDTPLQLALAVALGLFCGIAPIWGYQMAAAALLAHKFRLNKAIALTASNISFPLMTPVILAAGLYLGYFLRTGQLLHFEGENPVRLIPLYVVDWLIGSLILAGFAAVCGGLLAFVLARVFGYSRVKEAT